MAKKGKEREPIVFQFDHEDSAAGEEPVIDLFSDTDEDEKSASQPEKKHKKLKKASSGKAGEKAKKADPEVAPADAASAQADKPKRADKPQSEADEAEEAAAMIRAEFDRFGRNVSKRKKTRYGSRKNVPNAAPVAVRNDTISRREYEAAKARSRARAERREQKAQYERDKKKRERAARRRSMLRNLALGVGAIVILAFLGWFSTRVTTITVEHVPENYTAEEIETISGIRRGRSILFQRLNDAKDRIEKDAYLQANVRYTFPSTVTISLTERTPAACVRWGPQNEYIAIIDSKGIVLNTEAETTGGLIVAEGLSITAAQAGRALGDMTDLQIASLIRILSKLEELDLLRRSPRLSRIDMSEMMNISISTEGAPYSIEVGDSANLDTKLGLLQKHWDEIMQSASRYISDGYSTATIYLYTKGGVSVSPYEPGYNLAMTPINNYALPSGDAVVVTPAPITGDNPEETPDPDAPAPETPTPAPTPMPHQGGTFTG
ncbi:MAG: FtsQ-type POTRA domain-containing protein [Clostridia bacterium]|nr:FtsQ-type POTRA domain-containing protein [Clostridia bacterium]